MNVKTDRRTQSRKRPLSLVYVELPPANGGMMRDLNEHGFSLRAMMPLQLSEKLPFSLTLDNGVRIDGEAIVMRLEDKGHFAALEFAGLAAHSRDQIRRWLEKFEEPLSREVWGQKAPAATVSTLEELRQEARSVALGTPMPQVEAPAAPPVPEAPASLLQLQKALPPEPPPPLAPLVPPALQTETAVLPTVVPAQERIEPPPQSTLPMEEVPPVFPPEAKPPASRVPAAVPPQPHEEAPELPLPKFLRQPENAPPPPPAPQLPPLLKLSSVRPAPPPGPASEPVFPSVPPPAEEAPAATNPVPLSEVLIQPPSVVAAHPSPPGDTPAAARVSPRVLAPPLEPLSHWESESDSSSPGWVESFTLGRAIGIMIFLTLVVGSIVYHREVGHALIWLGGQIAGEEPQEPSQVTRPAPPAATPSAAEPAVPTSGPAIASSSQQLQQTAGSGSKAAEPPAASDQPPVQAPADTAAPDSPSRDGQDEYQRAMQILKAPSRRAELPEAVRLLWISVRKNNVGAEITLAELYHQGRGVTKSCDQTRILLSAAARRGSPDAKRRLREFQRERCRD